MSNRARAGLGACVLALLWALAPATAAGNSIAPGYDLFETDPQNTGIEFASPETALPADFFGPGSQLFTGVVPLGGVPLGSFNGHGTGNADTVVHRPTGGTFPMVLPGSTGPIPIQIVALNLVSVQPIIVHYTGGNPEAWTVDVTLSTTPRQGQMNVTKNTAQGGTFSA